MSRDAPFGRVSSPVTLASKVAFLSRADSYAEHPAHVDTIETHISWVFLAGSRVYKLKKPVHYDYLDFSTIEARRADCDAEVRLNRRLAPDVYLGVVPLQLRDNELSIGGIGSPVDWLVEMRRLPADRMLDRALRAGIVERKHVMRIADRMAAFYADAQPMPMRPAAYRESIVADVTDDCRWLCHPEFGLDRDLVERPSTALLGVLRRSDQLIQARAGRLVEGHGDLRPEHVAIGDGRPVVIDCLEFRAEYRVVDPVDELAFLGVECERLKAPWVGPALLERYGKVLGDEFSELLVDFYAARRAILRAKLAVWHLRDADVRNAGKWQDQANEYLALANRHAERPTPAIRRG